MPKISIIVPVYKVEPYLRRCVDSILAQTFTDFELILVDDGSPDNCPAICDEYAQKDKRVCVLHQQNAGVSAARNAGLVIARGKYVMFCDSDDAVEPRWVEMHLNVILEHTEAWVVSNLYRIDEAGTTSTKTFDIPKIPTYFDIYKTGLSAYVVNKIYRREILGKHGIAFDQSCRFGEDVGFNVNYFRQCTEVRYISTPLYRYYSNPNGAMQMYYSNWLEMHLPIFMRRLPLIATPELSEYCDIWLYQFLQMLDIVFKPENKMNFFQKLRYNQRMVATEEFQYCLAHCSAEKENPRVLMILKKKNYYIYWLYQKLAKLKNRLRGK